MVSIHAPLARCDFIRVLIQITIYCFNPRTPCEVRLFPHLYLVNSITVSIHAPLARCDSYCLYFVYNDICCFNPRTPCEVRRDSENNAFKFHGFNPRTPCEVRLLTKRLLLLRNGFNPRTPCEVRPYTWEQYKSFLRFQSTHPLRGATWRHFAVCTST